jgi:polyhydroxybutyrate depolymerase
MKQMKKITSGFKTGFVLFFLLIQIGAKAQSDSVLVGNIYRSYIIHLPSGYNPAQQYPVVLNLHGIFSNAAQQEALTEFNTIADSSQFIVVYPNAVAGSWNVSGATTSPNDSVFIATLLDTLTMRYSVDPCRIYATGFSQGGFMCYVLACMFADRLAAVAVVSGNMFDATVAVCNPSNSIPIMHIHGTADPIVLYWGIIGLESWVPGTVYWWAQQNNCNLNSVTVQLPNPVLSDSSDVQMVYYAPGPDSSEVIFLQVNNGGHTWPGASILLPFGFTNQDFEASNSIWNFFNSYQLRSCASTQINEVNTMQNDCVIYPNPFSSQTTIEFSTEQRNTSIKIIDVLGKEIKSITFTGKQFVLYRDELPAGVFFLQISNELNEVTYKKIIAE